MVMSHGWLRPPIGWDWPLRYVRGAAQEKKLTDNVDATFSRSSIAVTHMVYRHPTVLAGAAASLNEIVPECRR